MSGDERLVSPKQVARALGVSESSLKRWCDHGVVAAVRTAGGHRRIAIAEVLRFAREGGRELVSPEVIGLPPASAGAIRSLEQGLPRLVEALQQGEELLARQIVFDLYLAKHSLCTIFDQVIAEAFHQIGDRWDCGEAEIYQERRACEITLRILFELRRTQPLPDRMWRALGGTVEGDLYALPSAMVELVLRDAGFHAVALGTSIPISSLLKAVEETRPQLFWLSASHLQQSAGFLADFARLSQACRDSGTALVVGGRALTSDLRHRMNYAAHCDTMQHLASFAATLIQTAKVAATSIGPAVPEAGRQGM